MSVLADSAVLEVLELDREHLSYIPDFLKKIIRKGIRSFKDYDDYDLEKELH